MAHGTADMWDCRSSKGNFQFLGFGIDFTNPIDFTHKEIMLGLHHVAGSHNGVTLKEEASNQLMISWVILPWMELYLGCERIAYSVLLNFLPSFFFVKQVGRRV